MDIKKAILPNGLRLVTADIPGLESVTCMILTEVGSRYESRDKLGLSHVFEHMVFKGTKTRPIPGDIAEAIESVGGDSNAFTSKEFTGYYIRLSSEKLELALDLLSDMVLNPIFNPDELKKELEVVLEERKKNIDVPARHIYDMIEEEVFGDQPIGWPIIGTPESVRSVSQADLFDFISTYYRPQNMVVVIAGKLPTDVGTKVEKYLHKLKAKDVPAYQAAIVEQVSPRVYIDKRKFEQANLIVAVEGVARSDQDQYPLKVLNAVLGEGMSSRLFRELREKRGLAYAVRSYSENYHDTGIFEVYAGVGLDKVDEAVKTIVGEFGKVIAAKVSDKELQKGKEIIKGQLKLELESTLGVAEEIGLRELLEKQVLTVEEISSLVDRVTAEDVLRAAKRIFRTEKLNLSLIGPFEDEKRFLKLLKV